MPVAVSESVAASAGGGAGAAFGLEKSSRTSGFGRALS